MSVAITGQEITYGNIKEAVLLYIKRYCKNIGVMRNDIPVHFDKTHRFIYNLLFYKENALEPGSYCLTLSYNSDKNRRLRTVQEEIVIANIDNLFLKNNLRIDRNIATINELLRLIQLILKFFSKKILRVYFPLTNNYAYFYDGLSEKSENVTYTIAPVQIGSKNQIITFLENFYSNLIGIKSKNDKNNSNLFYSLLYKMDIAQINFKDYSNYALSSDKTILADEKFQINIT